MSNIKTIGVDIGGTKVCAGLVENDKVVKQQKLAITSSASEKVVVDEIINTIKEVMEPDVKGIGVGVPGFVDDVNGIVYQVNNIPSWNKVPLKKYFEKAFNVPVYVNNDANSFAIGEKAFGKGKKYKHFVGITLGTGLGAGIITNNKLLTGVNCGAGELAFVPYKDSHYEKYCSGQFFKDLNNIDGTEVFEKAKKGDKTALQLYEEFGTHIGAYIKVLLLAYAPEAVIFGGSINDSFQFFEKSLKDTVATFPFQRVKENFQIEVSDMKDTAILGPAALFYNEN